MTFEEITIALARVPRQKRRQITRGALAAADASRELERLRLKCEAPVGKQGMRELAFALCLWAERVEVIDKVFSVETCGDDIV